MTVNTKTFAAAAAVVALLAATTWTRPSAAAGILKSQLAGPWTMTLVGTTACGATSMYVTFDLNTSGTGSARTQYHTANCGDGTNQATPFVIQSLGSLGVGTANLSCGTGCGYQLMIQVDSGRRLFSAVDVDAENPGNFLQGVAIHR